MDNDQSYVIDLSEKGIFPDYDEGEAKHFISFGDGVPLKTPGGKKLADSSKSLIRQIWYELEAEEEVNENTFGLYSILSTKIDFIEGQEFIDWEHFWHALTHDPVLATCAGPEMTFQLSRLSTLRDFLEENDISHPMLPQVGCMEMEEWIRENEGVKENYDRLVELFEKGIRLLDDYQKTVVRNCESMTYGYLLATRRCTALGYSAGMLAGHCIDHRTFSDVEKEDGKEAMKGYESHASKLLQFLDLTEGEKDPIKLLIADGENKTTEFKETLSLDVKSGKKESYIELSAFKTIAAFLNTNGGTLLVGVNDSGQVTGIDEEIEKFHKGSKDKFLLHFKNILKSRIGEGNYPLIEYALVTSVNRTIFQVVCKASNKACYLDGKDFYVRTNPATDKLEGPKLVEYVTNHFMTK